MFFSGRRQAHPHILQALPDALPQGVYAGGLLLSPMARIQERRRTSWRRAWASPC